MNGINIEKHLLADDATRSIIEDTFNRLSEMQTTLLSKYADEPNVKQYVWLSMICADELRNSTSYFQGCAFFESIMSLWEYYIELPNDFKIAFSEHWDAVERMMIHVGIFDTFTYFVDNVVARYVETRASNIDFIQGTLKLFDQIDMYYHPDSVGAMTEDERAFILAKTCDAYRPLLIEQRKGNPTLRDRIAIEVFEMVNYWGNDEYFDRLENYPIGPEIDAKSIEGDISRVVDSGLFDQEEINAYKHIRIRDLFELIKIYLCYHEEGIDEAMRLYEYFGRLIGELGDEVKSSYYNKYYESGEMLKKEQELLKDPSHGKRKNKL